MHETWIRSLGREDPLEKEAATHSSILAWDISLTEDPGRGYSPWGCKQVGHNLVTKQQQQNLMLDPMTDWEGGGQALITQAVLVSSKEKG